MGSQDGNARPTGIMRVALLTTFAASKKDPPLFVFVEFRSISLVKGLRPRDT
jgi:hypothetical protein